MQYDADVIIIGTGFGASVSALRLAEAGLSVIMLEKGGWITREQFEADDDMFWQPEKGRYGMNELKKRGPHVIPWLGVGVGGGSHVYAGTIKRRDFFDDFPAGITPAEMNPYYERGERMMQSVKYPDHPPYNQLPAYRLFRKAERRMARAYPELVEDQGDILLAISYAPPGERPGAEFTNAYGARQRYADPSEQKILGGEIDVKNTLDKNYLFEAQKLGVDIRPFTEVDRITPLETGGYSVHWNNPREDQEETGKLHAKILVCAAGAIGSTELLMQCKDLHRSLPKLSDQLGQHYFTNGDFVTFLVPKKGLLISWIGVLALVVSLFLASGWLALAGLLAYAIGWFVSDPKVLPDMGTTNSDYIRFKHRDGSTQGAYLEGGRYPTPIKAVLAIIYSLLGKYDPKDYGKIGGAVNWMGKYVPFFELLERTWPVPILMMGRDDAVGTFHLNDEQEAEIHYPIEDNKAYVAYLNRLGRLFAREAKSYYLPNKIAEWLKIVEIPHNMGGVVMGNSPADGVVDTYGRVFGYDNFLVLDGSIMPTSLGPNPVGTILAFSERAMEKVVAQWQQEGRIKAETE